MLYFDADEQTRFVLQTALTDVGPLTLTPQLVTAASIQCAVGVRGVIPPAGNIITAAALQCVAGVAGTIMPSTGNIITTFDGSEASGSKVEGETKFARDSDMTSLEASRADGEAELASSSDQTLLEASLLLKACESNHVELAKYYFGKLEYRLGCVVLRRDHWKVLQDAAANGHTEIVQWICDEIDPGMDMVVGSIANGSPLRNAWLNGHYRTAVAICEGLHHPNYDEVREFVKDMFIKACENGHSAIAIDMAARYEGLSRPAGFVAACAYGHLGLAQALTLNTKIDPPKREDVIDALHAACEGGHLKVASWLIATWNLDKRSVIQTRGRRGLHVACIRGHANVVMWVVNEFEHNINEDDFDYPGVLAGLGHYVGLALWLINKYPALRDKIAMKI